MPVFHKSVTFERVEDAIARRDSGLDNPGFCLSCGIEVDGVEPDAQDYLCEACGNREVVGAEHALLLGWINVEDAELEAM